MKFDIQVESIHFSPDGDTVSNLMYCLYSIYSNIHTIIVATNVIVLLIVTTNNIPLTIVLLIVTIYH